MTNSQLVQVNSICFCFRFLENICSDITWIILIARNGIYRQKNGYLIFEIQTSVWKILSNISKTPIPWTTTRKQHSVHDTHAWTCTRIIFDGLTYARSSFSTFFDLIRNILTLFEGVVTFISQDCTVIHARTYCYIFKKIQKKWQIMSFLETFHSTVHSETKIRC